MVSAVGDNEASLTVCLQCKSRLEPSGQEPYRFVCPCCGQNYVLVAQLVPTEPLRPPALEGECSPK